MPKSAAKPSPKVRRKPLKDMTLREILAMRKAQGRPVDVKYMNGTERRLGYVVALARSLVLLQENREFRHSGHVIFPIGKIDGLRTGGYEDAYHRVLRAEGMIYPVEPVLDVDLSSLAAALRSLRSPDRCIGIELPGEKTGYALFIGKVRRVTNTHLLIDCYSGTYEWDTETTKLLLKDIMSIIVGSHYINVTQKHVLKQKRSTKR